MKRALILRYVALCSALFALCFAQMLYAAGGPGVVILAPYADVIPDNTDWATQNACWHHVYSARAYYGGEKAQYPRPPYEELNALQLPNGWYVYAPPGT